MQIPLTREQLNSIPRVYSTNDVVNPICHLRFSKPDGSKSWYVREAEISDDDVTILFFGYIHTSEWSGFDWNYFNIHDIEMEGGILDQSFEPKSIEDIAKQMSDS